MICFLALLLLVTNSTSLYLAVVDLNLWISPSLKTLRLNTNTKRKATIQQSNTLMELTLSMQSWFTLEDLMEDTTMLTSSTALTGINSTTLQ